MVLDHANAADLLLYAEGVSTHCDLQIGCYRKS